MRWQRVPPRQHRTSKNKLCRAPLSSSAHYLVKTRLSHSQGSVTSSTLPKTSGSKVHEPLASKPCMPQRFCCFLHSSLDESRVSGTILDPGFWFLDDKGLKHGKVQRIQFQSYIGAKPMVVSQLSMQMKESSCSDRACKALRS